MNARRRHSETDEDSDEFDDAHDASYPNTIWEKKMIGTNMAMRLLVL